jgi:hypothetical protein
MSQKSRDEYTEAMEEQIEGEHNEEDIEGEKTGEVTYVVHGAKIICTCGNREARLIVPISHGVYLKKKAQLNKGDSIPMVNVQSMGVCVSNYYAMLEEEAENEKRGFFKILKDYVREVFKGEKSDEKKAMEAKLDNVVEVCVPEIMMEWENTKEDCLVDGKEALLSISLLKCSKGGTIYIVDDGQEG